MPDLADTDFLRAALADARHAAEMLNAQRNTLVAMCVALIQRCGGGPVVLDLLALEAATKRRIISASDSEAGTLTLSIEAQGKPAVVEA